MKFSPKIGLALVGLCPVLLLAARPASAQIDQFNPTPIGYNNGYGVIFNAPLGQSFTPQLDQIGFVQLYLLQAGRVPLVVSTSILLGDGTGGSVLGTSNTAIITDTQPDFISPPSTNFTFAQPIRLIPGNQYTILVNGLSGDGFVQNLVQDTYAGGQLYLYGRPDHQHEDLAFAEGPSLPVPEASSMVSLGLLLALGLGGLMVSRRRRATRG